MKVEINGIEFKSKNEAKDYLRKFFNEFLKEIDRENPYYYIRKDNNKDLYKFLKKLVVHNEEKKKLIEERKIKYFGLQRNERNYKSFQTYIKFKDGSSDDVSFLNCVDLIGGNNKMPDWLFDLRDCLRKTIKDQTIQYKNERIKNDGYISCDICDDYTDKLEVDHIYKFRKLVDDFIKNRDIENEIKNIIVDDLKNGGKMFKENTQIKKDFEEYHQKNATLRLLCKKCNLKEH